MSTRRRVSSTPLADLGEPEEHAPEQRVELVGCGLDDAVGGAGDRRRHAAGLAVALDGEGASVAELPCRPEGVGQQRQRARLAGNVAQDHLDQPRLEAQPRGPGGLGDGAAQFAGVHRAEEDLVGGDGSGELRVGAQSAVEVGANADDDRPWVRQQRVDERLTLRCVGGEGEQLLELVDDEETIGLARHIHRRAGPGGAQRHAGDTGDQALLGGADESGAQHRRLAAARRADQRQQRTGGEARRELGHDVLATEEEAPVGGFERLQAAVGALGGRQRRRDARSRQREHPLGSTQTAQAMGAQVHEPVPLGQARRYELGGYRRHEDLAAVGLAAQTSSEVDGGTEVVGAAPLGLAGVEAEADREVELARPVLVRQGFGRGDRRVQGVRSRSRTPKTSSRLRPSTGGSGRRALRRPGRSGRRGERAPTAMASGCCVPQLRSTRRCR